MKRIERRMKDQNESKKAGKEKGHTEGNYGKNKKQQTKAKTCNPAGLLRWLLQEASRL